MVNLVTDHWRETVIDHWRGTVTALLSATGRKLCHWEGDGQRLKGNHWWGTDSGIKTTDGEVVTRAISVDGEGVS